ncbi:MAG: NAD(P)/FAD-dependent oxidoreductase [Actinomycetota bacterium]|nr:NAD(P)/FAD-dependent oxidoreductase [Actinomycetota bacterium]MDD5668027.1 NAD(P)/FAD-dependent oxidoreductase [Actinomycetota bacterium]
MKVIVVGAGTSGLAAAYTLRKRGADVVALESKELAGGRIIGARREGYTMDLGAQFFFKFYETTFGLCREIGLGNDIVTFPFKVALTRNGKLYPLTAGLDPRLLWRNRDDLVRFRGLSLKAILQFLRISPLLLKRRRDLHFIDYANMLDLDDESLADLALRRGGEDILEYLFQPIASCLTLGEPEDVGAGYGLSLLWYALNGLFTLKRGIGSLAERLYEECAQDVRLSTPVKRIVIEGGAVKGVETQDGLMEADAVVCTTTATRALELMPDLPDGLRGPMRKVTYSACCHTMFGLEDHLLPEGWYAVGLTRRAGTSMAGFTDNSVKSPQYTPPGGGMVHCFTFGRHAFELNAMPDADVFSRLKGEIRRFVPTMPDEPLFSEIYRWDEAVCLSPPGMLREIHNMKRDHYRDVKGLFLAGEYMNMPSVDGSLRSGIDAAEAALRS